MRSSFCISLKTCLKQLRIIDCFSLIDISRYVTLAARRKKAIVLAKHKVNNTYRTALSLSLDLFGKEDSNVGRSEAESNNEIFLPQQIQC